MKIKNVVTQLLWVWKCIFTLAVADDDLIENQDDEPLDEPAEEPLDEPAEDPLDEPAEEPLDEPAEEPRQSRGAKAIAETRRRAQEAEARAQAAEEKARQLEERMLQSLRPAVPAGPSEEDILRQQEDAALRDPNTSDNDRYWINFHREQRANKAQLQEMQKMVRETQAATQDAIDRSRFERLAASKPAIYDTYATRVEQEVQKLRAKGQSASREDILAYLVGKDAIEGRTSKPKAAPPKAPATPRGKTPGVRSDVPGRGVTATEKQQREKRLENVRL